MSTTDTFSFIDTAKSEARQFNRERYLELLDLANQRSLSDAEQRELATIARTLNLVASDVQKHAALVRQRDDVAKKFAAQDVTALERAAALLEQERSAYEVKARQQIALIDAERERLTIAFNAAMSRSNEGGRLQNQLRWIDAEFDRLFGTTTTTPPLGDGLLDRLFFESEQQALGDNEPRDPRPFSEKHIDAMVKGYRRVLKLEGHSDDRIDAFVTQALPRLRARVQRGRSMNQPTPAAPTPTDGANRDADGRFVSTAAATENV